MSEDMQRQLLGDRKMRIILDLIHREKKTSLESIKSGVERDFGKEYSPDDISFRLRELYLMGLVRIEYDKTEKPQYAIRENAEGFVRKLLRS
ncbi:MAG: hypothetical protein QXR58_00185 [Candidatus Micrarchaeaceae archaeon]